jgi:hypothetical protein
LSTSGTFELAPLCLGHFPFLRILAVDHQHLADLLHGMRREPLADRSHPLPAKVAIGARRAHLDELVGLQRAVDLRHDFVREPLVADDHDGSELVRLRAQFASAGRCERHRRSISR